jgi:hypothetical protein
VWAIASALLGDEDGEYWSRTRINPYLAPDALSTGIKHLLAHNRPSAALHCMELLIHHDAPLDTTTAIAALNGLYQLPGEVDRVNGHAIVDVIKAVQAAPDASPDEVARIELRFLTYLDDYHGAFPTTLEHMLANDPVMYCEMIQTIYKPRHQEHTEEPHSDEMKAKAHAYFTILHKWRIPPGCSSGHEYSGPAMAEWLNTVKSLSLVLYPTTMRWRFQPSARCLCTHRRIRMGYGFIGPWRRP